MIDENYHIADLDDIEHQDESIGEIKIKEKPVIRTRVIYENSDTSEDDDRDRRAEFFEEKRESGGEKRFYSDEERDSDYREFRANSNVRTGETEGKRKFHVEDWILDMYDRRPNTFKATIVGIILAILILLIGFAKTLLIFVVVFIANIVGQFLDSNPRILSIIDAISRRMK